MIYKKYKIYFNFDTLALPWLTSLVNSVYYNTAALYKKKGYKKRPSYGYGRTSDDYYDDYDYDSKYLDRYDKVRPHLSFFPGTVGVLKDYVYSLT